MAEDRSFKPDVAGSSPVIPIANRGEGKVSAKQRNTPLKFRFALSEVAKR